MKLKRSGSFLFIFLVPIIIISGIIVCFAVTYFYTTTTVDKNGKTISTVWAKDFASDFSQYISDTDDFPMVSEDGLALLDKNHLWLQIIDENGDEVSALRKPDTVSDHYSPYDLLNLFQYGTGNDTAIINQTESQHFTYIIGFPFKISKVISYVDTQRYNEGKIPIIAIVAVTLSAVLIFSIVYVTVISKNLTQIQQSLNAIALRKYKPLRKQRFLHEIYDGINELDKDIHEADLKRERTEKSREEWITNITHDLKTPLAPIKGYAEILSDRTEELAPEKARRYGEIIGKNVMYAQQLINDLKLTYQLKNSIIPVKPEKRNLSRFIKETIIDILNNPDYENASVGFETNSDMIEYCFDACLLKRALNNIIINSIVHNDKAVDINVQLELSESIKINITDNGRGMSGGESEKLFERYYRGTSTQVRPEGTGLGMAIAKQIVELHSGTICVNSTPGIGTQIMLSLPAQKN